MAQRAAVIGAGIAGAACARRLAAAGWEVELFDEGVKPGGRLSTLKFETPIGPLRFDAGAQYITARSDEFSAKVRRWIADGFAEPWGGRLAAIDEKGTSKPLTALSYVGKPDMGSVVEAELKGLNVRQDVRVAKVQGEPNLWRLIFADGSERGFFHAVVAATPGETAADLLMEAAPNQASAARRVRIAPSWAAMVAFDRPIEAPYDGVQIARGPISWAARDGSKPGRDGAETWVIHAAPGWSFEYDKIEPEDAASRLVDAFRRRLKTPDPVWKSAVRWKFAQVERAVGSPFGWDAALKVGSCGDWYLGPRVELAWQSGYGLAHAVIESASA
jgi:predicted NAD/FAD-dependent oxidoreductase